jgi:branched-chain amino acid transport system permease protein
VLSPFGRVLRAIRDDEVAASVIAKDVNRYRVLVLTIGAMFSGFAGVLYAHYVTFIDPSTFTVMESMTILLMVVFGGTGSLVGSAIGALVLVIVPEVLRFADVPSSVAAPLRQMIYGLLLVVVMMVRPKGLLGTYTFR